MDATPTQITDIAAIKTFVLAGKAVFTIRNAATGNRFTYKVEKSKPNPRYKGSCWFVKLLNGPDNSNSYVFLGTITDGENEYRHGQRSPVGDTAPSALAFTWVWKHIRADQSIRTVEFWHEGHCCVCNRLLTVPESLTNGIGPECRKRIGLVLPTCQSASHPPESATAAESAAGSALKIAPSAPDAAGQPGKTTSDSPLPFSAASASDAVSPSHCSGITSTMTLGRGATPPPADTSGLPGPSRLNSPELSGPVAAPDSSSCVPTATGSRSTIGRRTKSRPSTAPSGSSAKKMGRTGLKVQLNAEETERRDYEERVGASDYAADRANERAVEDRNEDEDFTAHANYATGFHA